FVQVAADVPVVSGAGSSRLTGGTLQLINYPPGLQLTGGTVVLLPGFQDTGAITNLIIEGAALAGTNTLTGELRWRSGTLNGALTIAASGALMIEGSGGKTWNAAVTNLGTIQFGGTGEVSAYAANGARVENAGLFEFTTDRDFYGYNTPVFRNTGTIRKSGGTGNARLGVSGSWPVSLENLGTLESQSGVLQLFGGGSLAGQMVTASGARVELVGGTFVQVAADVPVVSGAGSSRLTGGTLQLLNEIPGLQLAGGTVLPLPLFQAGGAITNLTLSGATLGGSNVVTGTLNCTSVSGPLTVAPGGVVTWLGGTFAGPVTVQSDGLLRLTTTSGRTLNGALTNVGTVEMVAAGSLSVFASSGGRLENAGLFDIQADFDLYGYNTPVFRNTGTLRKSAGPGTARVGVAGAWGILWENLGRVESLSGILQFFGTGILTGEYTTVSGTRVELVGGTWTDPAGPEPVFDGTGASRFTGGTLELLDQIPNLELTGGTVMLLPDFQNDGAITNLTLSGATLGGSNVVTGTLNCTSVSGPLTVAPGGVVTWLGGTFAGPVTVQSDGLLRLTTTSGRTLNGALTNVGTVEMVAAGSLSVFASSGGRLENAGLFDIQADFDLYGYNTPVFRNTGTLRKSAGPGTARVGVAGAWGILLENSGLVDARVGTLGFFGTYNLTGGVLRAAIRSLSDYGRINFASSVPLAGTLGAYLVGGYTPAVGNKFTLVSFPGSTGAFDPLELPAGFTWQPEYAAANFSVTVLGACTPPPSGIAAWWPAEGTPSDIAGGHSGVLQNGAAYAPGLAGQALSLDGTDDYLEVNNPAGINYSGGAAMSVALWVYRTGGATTAHLLGKRVGCGTELQYQLAYDPDRGLHFGALPPNAISTGVQLPLHAWKHLAATLEGGIGRFYIDGQLVVETNGVTLGAANGAALKLGGSGDCATFGGLLDEVLFFNRALGSNEVAAIYIAGAAGLCRPTDPPFIVTHPASRTNAPGSTASFSVSAGGSPPLAYQWLRGGSPLANDSRINGAQSNVLVIANVQLSDAGTYSVTVTNGAGSTNSLAAQLVVDATPPVLSQVTATPGLTQAGITWQTDEPATTAVEHGLTAALGTTNTLAGLRTNHSVTLSGLTPGVTYHYRVRSADAVGNVAVSTVATFTQQAAPDLVASVPIGPAAAQLGQSISLAFGITNLGGATANGPWQNAVLVANDANGSGAFTIHSASFNPGAGGLPPGGSLVVTQTFIVPVNAVGARHLGIRLDSSSQVVEVNEANNSSYALTPTTITAPDLRVATVSAPAAAQFGQTFNVEFVITNAGGAPAPFVWNDRVYLSSFNNSISGATLLATVASPFVPVGAGQAYTNTASVTLPLTAQSAPGGQFIVVAADQGNAIAESAENNNLGAAALTLTLPPLPDFVVTNVLAAPNALPGQSLPVVWTTANEGNAAVNGVWSETVFLATNSAGAGAQELATFLYTNSLAAGGVLTRTQSVVIPPASVLGNLWFTVLADSRNDFIEGSEANNVGVAGEATLVPAVLTLQLTFNQINEGSSQPLVATVTRNGSRATPLTVTLTNGDPTQLSFTNQIIIPAGQASASFHILALLDGVVDGPQTVNVGALSPGFETGVATVTVLDVDLPQLSVTLGANELLEALTTTVTVSRDAGTNEAVLVTLNSSSASQLIPPLPVTIPPGEYSATATVLALEDTLVEAPLVVTVTATANGYHSGSATLTVLDNDWPVLTLNVAPDTVSENAGPLAALVTLTRHPVSPRALEVDLESSNTNAARVPSLAIIPAGETSVTFPLSAVDNALVDGEKTVELHSWFKSTGTGIRLGSGLPAVVTVTDDDGPTLLLTLDKHLVAEGQNPAATGTVTRNTGTNVALLVNLASSDITEITVLPTVTIPAGALSAQFTLASVSDAETDGNQTVTVSASAAGFTPGAAQITVTDVNLPDLVVAGITAPATAETESFVNIGYQIRNQGLSPSPSNAIVQRVYLSSDSLVGNDVLIGQFTFNASLPAGSQFGQSFSAAMPQASGDYWVIVETDALNGVLEILENNNVNVSSSPIQVQPAYEAAVFTTLESAPAGTPVPLTGQAFRPGTGQPAPFVLVNIHI
ncbi:MAG: immunoglobulin domain-containing protein, partial [Verrucomicrobia bacterium]|nr:immunoglobulin domain-containing protein [Verrucomicrobiota bacterium]